MRCCPVNRGTWTDRQGLGDEDGRPPEAPQGAVPGRGGYGRPRAQGEDPGVVGDAAATAVSEARLRAAKTGEIGDGKILVSSQESVVRIRTGEKGEAAVEAIPRVRRREAPSGPRGGFFLRVFVSASG